MHAAAAQRLCKGWHFLHAFASTERFTVVDAASMPSAALLRNPIRARDEICIFTVVAHEEIASNNCLSTATCLSP